MIVCVRKDSWFLQTYLRRLSQTVLQAYLLLIQQYVEKFQLVILGTDFYVLDVSFERKRGNNITKSFTHI